MNDDTLKSTADAVKATAELGSKTIDVSAALSSVVKGPVDQIVGIVEDKFRLWRWERQLKIIDRAKKIMRERGMTGPTKQLPPSFVVPLLQQSMLQDDDDLQEAWAQLLVNAGDELTSTEPRTAYVNILAEMTAFDAKNLSVLAEYTLGYKGKVQIPSLETWTLPNLTNGHDEIGESMPKVPEHIAVSVSNLARLGVIEAASATFGGKPIFQYVSLTPLGLAFHRACSNQPRSTAE